MTRTISIDEAKHQLSDLINLSAEGIEIVISDKGKPVARLIAIAPKKKRTAGLNRGTVWTSEDFDEPVPNEFWMGHK